MIKGPIKVESIDEAVSFIKDVLVGTMKKSDAGDEVSKLEKGLLKGLQEAVIAKLEDENDKLRADLATCVVALSDARHELWTISCATRFGDNIQAANADAAKRAVDKIDETLAKVGKQS